MTTGAAWNEDNPLKPWALFDADAIRDIPVEWDLWFADIGSAHFSHAVILSAPLVLVGSSEAEGVIKVRITTDGTGTIGTKYPFTVRAVAVNGERGDKTLWLKLAAR